MMNIRCLFTHTADAEQQWYLFKFHSTPVVVRNQVDESGDKTIKAHVDHELKNTKSFTQLMGNADSCECERY